MIKQSPVLIIAYVLLFLVFATQVLSGFFMRSNDTLWAIHKVFIWPLLTLVVIHWILAIPKVRIWLNKRSKKQLDS